MNNKNRKKFNIYLSIFAVAAIVVTMFFSSLVVNAAGSVFDFVSDFNLSDSSNYFTLDSFHNSDVYQSNNFQGIENFEVPFDLSSDDISNIQSAVNGSTSVPIDDVTIDDYFINNSLSSSGIDSSLPNKVCCYHKQNDGFELVFFYLPDNSFVQFNSSGSMFIYSPANNDIPAFVYYTSTKGYTVYSFPSTTTTIDDTTYYSYLYITSSQYNRLVTSSVPIYMVNSMDGTTSGHIDYNYSCFNSGGSSSGSGALSKADIEANSLLKNGSKIYLTNNSFNVGDLIIYPVLTETQKNNPNNFKLRLTGTCTYSFSYNSDASNIISCNGNSVYSLYGPFSSDRENSVRGVLSSEAGSYIDYSFSELLSGKKSITLDQLNSHYAVSGRDNGIQPLASGLDGTFGGYGFWSGIGRNFNGTSINGFNFNFFDAYELTRYDLVPLHAHYIIEAWVVGNGVQASSPTSVIDVDLVTGELQPIVENYATDEQIMSALDTDILPSGYANANAPVSPNNMQGAITNSANASSGGAGGSGGNSNSNSNIESGAIVINNNPTFNNKNDLSSDGNSGLIPFILGLIAGNQKASTSTVENISNTDGWLSIMNTTFSFVPAGVWTLLIGAFTAAIGIMIVSFILGIIIKFIT